MTDPDPDPVNIDDLAAAEDSGNVVDQQTAAEAGIDDAEDDAESEAHPT